jgi:hypothetical protein
MKATFWSAAVLIGIIQWIANAAYERIFAFIHPVQRLDEVVAKQLLNGLAGLCSTR